MVARAAYAQAEPVLRDAIKQCEIAKIKTARPLMALGKVFFESNRCAEAIPLFQQSLAAEPNLGRAYMDLCACQTVLERFDEAIDSGAKAVQFGEPQIQGMANYNLGLAYFKSGAARGKFDQARASAPYFEKSAELMPEFGSNYFFLGVLKELARKKAEATPLYEKACRLGDQSACQKIGTSS